MKLLVIGCLLVFSLVIHAQENSSRELIRSRIRPIGEVRLQKELSLEKKHIPGKTIYEQHCIVCHREGLAGAPQFRKEQDWQPRQLNKTLEQLVASSMKGLNAMPSKGTCMNCNENDLKEAIIYMLPKKS